MALFIFGGIKGSFAEEGGGFGDFDVPEGFDPGFGG